MREALAELLPETANIHYLLGLALLESQRQDDALGQLELALQLSPDDPKIQSALESIRSASQEDP